LIWLAQITAKEYAELKLFHQLEYTGEDKLAMCFGVDPNKTHWKPDGIEQTEEQLLAAIRSTL
jgi:hypothetical protein